MRRHHLVLAFFLIIASAGCGSGDTVWVTGKLLKGGAKYTPPQGQTVNVTLVGIQIPDRTGKIVETSEPFWAEVDQAGGTFSVPGNDGRGIPPGKYRVAVTQKMTREAFDAANPKPKRGGPNRETDTLADKFGPANSPIVREVKASQELVVDLDNPAG